MGGTGAVVLGRICALTSMLRHMLAAVVARWRCIVAVVVALVAVVANRIDLVVVVSIPAVIVRMAIAIIAMTIDRAAAK